MVLRPKMPPKWYTGLLAIQHLCKCIMPFWLNQNPLIYGLCPCGHQVIEPWGRLVVLHLLPFEGLTYNKPCFEAFISFIHTSFDDLDIPTYYIPVGCAWIKSEGWSPKKNPGYFFHRDFIQVIFGSDLGFNSTTPKKKDQMMGIIKASAQGVLTLRFLVGENLQPMVFYFKYPCG